MKILNVSFFNDIWINKFPEFLILKELRHKDENLCVDYLSCKSILNNVCSCLTNKNIDTFHNLKKKNKVCNSCIKSSNFYSSKIKAKKLFLDNYINQKDKNEIDLLLQKININNFLEFQIDNIEIGKITLFNFLVDNKLLSEKFEEKHWEKFSRSLENSLIVFFGIKKILKENNYDTLMVFSAEYSFNKICVEYAKKYKIRILNSTIGKNPLNSNKYWNLYEASYEGNYFHCNKFWEEHRDNGISNLEIQLSKDWINSFLSSSSYLNFSTAPSSKNIRKIFNISNKYKKIVLVALSSTDERLGDSLLKYKQSEEKICKSSVFKNDVEWTKFLLKNVNKFNDIFFIFRPHPRDFGSKLSKNSSPLQSEALKYYYNISNNLPANCKFNFDMKLSIYDFIPEIDLLLNSSSTTSYEFGLFGIPTLIYDKNLYYYNNDLVFYTKNLEDYISKISNILNSKIDKKKIMINSFKWISMQVAHEPIDISDNFNINSTSLYFKIFNRIQRYTGNNFLDYLYFFIKNKRIKNFETIYKIINNKKSSVLEINLEKKEKINQNIEEQYEIVKNCMENILSKNKKFNKLLKKIQNC